MAFFTNMRWTICLALSVAACVERAEPEHQDSSADDSDGGDDDDDQSHPGAGALGGAGSESIGGAPPVLPEPVWTQLPPPTLLEAPWTATDLDVTVDERLFVVGTIAAADVEDAPRTFLHIYDDQSSFVRTETYTESLLLPLVESDSNGDLYLSGAIEPATEQNTTALAVWKLTAEGAILWQRTVSAEAGLAWQDADVDEDGNVTVCAMETLAVADEGTEPERAPLFVQFDAEGNLEWEARGPTTDTCERVAARGPLVLVAGTGRTEDDTALRGLGWLDVDSALVDWATAEQSPSLSLTDLAGYSVDDDDLSRIAVGSLAVSTERLPTYYWGQTRRLSDFRFGHWALVTDLGEERCCIDGELYDDYSTDVAVFGPDGDVVFSDGVPNGLDEYSTDRATAELGPRSVAALAISSGTLLRVWWSE